MPVFIRIFSNLSGEPMVKLRSLEITLIPDLNSIGNQAKQLRRCENANKTSALTPRRYFSTAKTFDFVLFPCPK